MQVGTSRGDSPGMSLPHSEGADPPQTPNASMMPLADMFRAGWKESADLADSYLSSECSTEDLESTCSSPTPCVTPELPAPVVFIFDWDDTLFATSVVRGVHGDTPFSPAMPASMLRRHAVLVEEVLRATRAVAHVAIVTLSKRPWVLSSAERFLPGLDMAALTRELDIVVYYAREEGEQGQGALADQDWTLLKRNSMARCLDELREAGVFSAESALGEALQPSVVSVGDSEAEAEALQGLIAAADGVLPKTPFCKTLKLMDRPNLSDLGDQLRQLRPWLPRIAAVEGDFEMRIAHPSEISAKARLLGK